MPTATQASFLFLLILVAGCTLVYILLVADNTNHAATIADKLSTFVFPSAIENFSRTSLNYAPRVMCMIFTTPDKWKTRGLAVRTTWSRHCHRRRFFYSRLGANKTADIQTVSDAVALNVTEGRAYLTAKTMTALKYSYENYGEDTDWYMKADDDAYVIWNNLIKYLRHYNASGRSYLGSRFMGTMRHLPRGYNSGGGVYLLSRGSAEKVLTEGIARFPKNCKTSGTSSWEDVDMGDCLRVLGVYPEDTKDSLQRQRFHSEFPLRFLKGILGEGDNVLASYFWAEYNGIVYGNSKKADRMLSNESITFHYDRGDIYRFARELAEFGDSIV